MMRFVFMAFFASLMIAPVQAEEPGPDGAECEYRPEWRGTDTADYVADINTCLTELKEGYWVDAEAEAELLERVNQVRADAGVPPLQFRPELLPAVRLHSFDMAHDQFFDHIGPDRRDVTDRVAALDRSLVRSEVRENIASIQGDLDWDDAGRILHNILFDSEGHRANMLAPNLTHMAMGVIRTEQGAWLTQAFVRQDGVIAAPVPSSLRVAVPYEPDVTLTGWDYRKSVLTNDTDEFDFSGPSAAPAGEYQMRFIGIRAVTENRKEFIRLVGPTVTLTD